MRCFKTVVPLLGMLVIASPVAAATITFNNPTPITIPASGSGVDTGAPSTPYPSPIVVSGFAGLTTDVTATLLGLSHTFPDDIDVLLVGPTGLKTLLMSDAGGSFGVVGVTLTFDDDAASFLPEETQISSGTYRPTNHSLNPDFFPAPAPAGPYVANPLSVFNGVNPNGTWALYVVDDAGNDIGTLAQGWSLTISDNAVTAVPEPATLLLLGTGLVAGVRRWRKLKT